MLGFSKVVVSQRHTTPHPLLVCCALRADKDLVGAFSAQAGASFSAAVTSVDGAKQRGSAKLPQSIWKLMGTLGEHLWLNLTEIKDPEKVLFLSHLYNTDLTTSDVSLVLTFVQELLDKGRASSTLKVYMAAWSLNPPRTKTVPAWDLSLVLKVLKSPSFELLQSVSLNALMLKMALLLAFAPVKRVGNLQGFSVDA